MSNSSIPNSHRADRSYILTNTAAPLYTPTQYMGRRATEKQMLSFIALGNLSLLHDYLQQRDSRPSVTLGTMSKEALMQSKYLIVTLVSSACRTAIDAGLPEHIAFSLSDAFIQKADRIHRPELFEQLMQAVIIEYCQAVHDYRLRPTSAPVRECCEYMLLQITGTVTLKDLSNICFLSEHYISDLFRKELGIGALQYFHLQKLHYAKHLVLHSRLSMTQIASSLNYPSASNFSQRFKKHFGTTPLQCRNHSAFKGELSHDD